MTGIEIAVADIDALTRDLNRRAFLKLVAGAAVLPRGPLGADDEEFFRRVAATLIPAPAVRATGIDVLENLRRLLGQARADHRKRIVQLIRGARRVSFLYGGDRMALDARQSRFVLMQKAARALSSICLLAFWGDVRALAIIDDPGAQS